MQIFIFDIKMNIFFVMILLFIHFLKLILFFVLRLNDLFPHFVDLFLKTINS